ncbi:protein fem-1 homolog B [Penaeus vannamei]|uniref:Fem-1-like B-like protein n=1 Tax=Penaeus vannamei TaxID=6689 RepID=A0A3R7M9Y0_PENVA|nr:protein fem-1 homolog B-like [Penaeus vannamei]ROT76986.1 fem-1-like B-like protein [Penaeus vannamei]
MTSGLESMKKKVYHAAKEGLSISLYAHLSVTPREECQELLGQVVEEDGQKCTPLLISARNGHEKAVRTLLKFTPDLEQEGTVKFDGYVIEGASPLWCAAGAGHLGVVKMLVRNGADVNHPTKTNSTPLRAACFDGRLDIVKYLTDHYANIHITNKYNNTCLMIAAYKGHVDVVQFLLELGANPDEKAHCGATALHFAAECGHVKIVKELLAHGAKITKNEHGMTPLIAAAERTRADVVEYLISRPDVTREEKVDALELLGASYASDKDNYDIELAYKYMMLGMKERYSDEDNIIRKPKTEPVPAYENRIECETVEELEAILHVPATLHMESLAIRERILGPHNPEVPHPVIFRGAVFADNARFDRCLQLWIHALRLKQLNKVCVMKDLLRFAQVFSQMLHVGVQLEFEAVHEVLDATVIELQRNQEKIQCPGPKDDVETIKDEMESNMITALYLIMIAVCVAKGRSTSAQLNGGGNGGIGINNGIRGINGGVGIVGIGVGALEGGDAIRPSLQQINQTVEKESQVYQTVYNLVRVQARTRSGQTLLHLAVNPDTPVDDFHTNHICRFPCATTTKLLIACGADVNSMDSNRNTPLHLIVPYQKPISDFLTLHNIIMALIENGAHMDTVNQMGATPFDSATTGVAEIILRTQKKLSLKCLAAKVIKVNSIPYKGQVPRLLEAFIELHGPGHVDGLTTRPSKSEHQL